MRDRAPEDASSAGDLRHSATGSHITCRV